MPLLLCKMGGQMLYIIHQRLTAQKAEVDRVGTVLREVARAVYAREFVEALFAAQDTGSVTDIYDIMNRLVHASIMRLSTTRCAL